MPARGASDKKKQAAATKSQRHALLARHDPLTSLVLTIPVFLVYHLGILGIDLRNGVDLVSEVTFQLLHASVLAYVGVTLAYAGGLTGAAFFLRKKEKIRPLAFLPVLIESLILAVVMLFLVGWATQQFVPGQVGPHPLGPFERLVMAAGAGYHEELVFRAGLFAGGAFLLRRFVKLSGLKAALLAGLVSSLLFSAVHYIGSMGDDFTVASFLFRFLSGVFLVVVYQYRGFAVSVYTHTFYDLMVFFVLPLLG